MGGDLGPPGTWQMFGRSSVAPELTAFSAVYACVSIISQDVAKLPMQVTRKDGRGIPIVQDGDYYAQLMQEPNDYQTGPDFMQLFVLSYLLQGNSYAYCKRNRRGEVSEMHVLDPRRTTPWVEPSGEVFYRCGANMLAGLKGGELIHQRDIIHHRLPLTAGFPLMGVTPIYAAAASSGVGLRILTNSESFFANSAQPGGALQTDRSLDRETKARWLSDWQALYSAGRSGKPAILDGGMKWQPLTMTALDAQLIEQLRFSVEDVGRVFRVPPFMLGDTTKTTYRNSEQLARAYLSGCLSFHLEALARRFARTFTLTGDWGLKFDLSQMLRAEIDVRFDGYQKALAAGWLTPNEARAAEGLEPVEGGDEPHIQSQYVPLSMSGELVSGKQPTPSGEDPPAESDPEAGDDDGGGEPAEGDDGDDGDEGKALDVSIVRRAIARRRAAALAEALTQGGEA